mgnify:CR=1 FL=1
MLLSSRHWLSVGLSQLFILMPTQILLAQNASGEGIAAEAPSGFLAILFSGGIVGAIMILLLLLIGPDHPPTTDDSIPLGGIRKHAYLLGMPSGLDAFARRPASLRIRYGLGRCG